MAATPPRGFTPLAGSERQLPEKARFVGPVDPQERIEVSIYLRSPSSETIAGDINEHARHPGQRMTREEFWAKHSASADDIAKVEQFAHDHHLDVVEVDPVKRKIALSGTAADVTAAFATELQRYELEGKTFRGRTGSLHVPAELEPLIVGVFGIDDRPQAHPHLRPAGIAEGVSNVSVQTLSYTPAQVARLYNFPTSLDGSGECIAIIELGGGYNPQDLAAYFQQQSIAMPSVVSVSVDGGQNSPVGKVDSDDGEVVLDIEVAGSVAPKARIAVYFAPNTDRGFIDAITQAVHDTTNAPSIISISWGSAESNWTAQTLQAMDQAFQTAAALGVTVCAAAGDNGSADGVTDQKAHVDYPASDPYVTGCGGTTLTASNNQITSEVVWNETANKGGATGGGISDAYPLPSWQAAFSIPPSVNDRHAGRGVPDVAGNADPQTGYQVYLDGQHAVFGGTSAVAPLWAGLIALLNQRYGKPLGFLNPYMYASYPQLAKSNALRDVTSGTNGAYTAGAGWDACTGLGTPNGAQLLQSVILL